MAEKRKPPPSFKLEIPGDDSRRIDFYEKMQKVCETLMRKLNKPVNNYEIMENLPHLWTKSNSGDVELRVPVTYMKVPKSQVNKDFFVTTMPSITKLMDVAAMHVKNCQGKLCVKRITKKGHCVSLKLTCTRPARASHTYLWSSSPYLPNGKYLINERINHAFPCSGMLPSQYARFCSEAKFGILSVDARDAFFKKHKEFVKQEYVDSTKNALMEEIGSYEDLDGIDIITHARHGWRKNSKDTSVVTIGEKTHKVLDCVQVTKADDPVAQRHELIGTKRIY